jgi:hypothetical protein
LFRSLSAPGWWPAVVMALSPPGTIPASVGTLSDTVYTSVVP